MPDLEHKNMLKVSVYVPCYNSKEYIDKCLCAILNQSYPVDEVLVINDGSNDGSAEIISRFPVRIINNDTNRGLSATRNIALNEARNNFVVSIDADCIVNSNWLEDCMKNFCNPKVAAVGGRLAEAPSNNAVNFWRGAHLKHHWGNDKLINPVFLSGSNLIIRKEALRKIGFYDQEKYRNNYEDVDLSFRLKKSGFELIYEPLAEAIHIRKDTVVSALKAYWLWKFHDYKQKYMIRPVFNLVNSIKLTFDDALKGNFRLIPMDILTFIFSTYFDFKNSLKKTL